MSTSYKTEMSIPVNKDPRTFEQRRQDMLSCLEKSYSSKTTTRSHGVPSGAASDTTASSFSSDVSGVTGRSSKAIQPYGEDWDGEVNNWIQSTRRKWNEDIRRMRRDMFALEPIDDLDLDNWDTFGLGSTSTSAMMEKMEREMQSMRQQMESISGLGQSPSTIRSSLGGAGSHSQVTSSRYSSATTRSSGDPRASMLTHSDVRESVQHSRTVDGVTTGSKSESAYSTSNAPRFGAGEEDRMLTQGHQSTAVVPHTNLSSGGMMDFLKDAYELGEDGKVHFIVHFDARNFAPEDIDVSTVNNRLTVHAKKKVLTEGTTSSREFCRTIDLPRSIDHASFQCNLTQDGVLILDAPVETPDYNSITFTDDHQLGIKPKSVAQVTATETKETSSKLIITGQTGPTILKDGTTGRKLHLEVPIDAKYKADELCVRVDANQIFVTGKLQRESGAEGGTTEQFSRSYEIPETVDPFSVTAQLLGTTLVIEAPLLCSV